MSAPQAIETRYKGYRFRSRLEARWAVFFDAAGIEWQYEPQGFMKGSHSYLPDFRVTLGKHRVWVEVKGDKDWLRRERRNLIQMHSPEFILPDFMANGGLGLMVLGDIPAPSWGLLAVPFLIWSEEDAELLVIWCDLTGHYNPRPLPGLMLDYFQMRSVGGFLLTADESALDFQPRIIKAPIAIKRVMSALDAARTARFEHGENGGAA